MDDLVCFGRVSSSCCIGYSDVCILLICKNIKARHLKLLFNLSSTLFYIKSYFPIFHILSLSFNISAEGPVPLYWNIVYIYDWSWCSLSRQYVSSTLRLVEQCRVDILENMEDHIYPVLADLW